MISFMLYESLLYFLKWKKIFYFWVIVERIWKPLKCEGHVWSHVLLAQHRDLSICFDRMQEKQSIFPLQLPHLSCFFLLKEGELAFKKEADATSGELLSILFSNSCCDPKTIHLLSAKNLMKLPTCSQLKNNSCKLSKWKLWRSHGLRK